MGVSYENGNLHTPVIVVGDDPGNEENVIVSRLATVSVPKNTISETEGTPGVDEEGNPVEETTEETTENEDDENAEA